MNLYNTLPTGKSILLTHRFFLWVHPWNLVLLQSSPWLKIVWSSIKWNWLLQVQRLALLSENPISGRVRKTKQHSLCFIRHWDITSRHYYQQLCQFVTCLSNNLPVVGEIIVLFMRLIINLNELSQLNIVKQWRIRI